MKTKKQFLNQLNSKCLITLFAIFALCSFLLFLSGCSSQANQKSDVSGSNATPNSSVADEFPDGTKIDSWFTTHEAPTLNSMGKIYNIVDYGASTSAEINTSAIQSAIDTCASNGGGVIFVPSGTFMSGALFFKQGVNLYVDAGGILKGSDDISNYPVMETRIEGEWCTYYPGLINADKCNGFTMAGSGTIDGNGQKSWKAFWQRRQWNKDCTNKDEQRARLLFISNSSNVTISGLRFQNSQFWTTHIYKCDHVKYINVDIFAPVELKPPSTDAIDIDACSDVLVYGCRMEVNDDAIALKGGKGPWADTDDTNGSNERIIIENCNYGYCHSCLTCGSESIHNNNIILRNTNVANADRLLWIKLRPDTPQNYEYITIQDITGNIKNFLYVYPWTQFFDLKGRTDKPISTAHNITMKNCNVNCDTYYNVEFNDDQYILKDFYFENNNVNYKDFGNEAFRQ